jgi:multidrug efflux pump subunit AcrA (membrane-fusion protein)
VLIIVLVMIGIGLAKSVKKVLSELPLVSEEEHVKLKEEVAKIDTSRDPAEVAAETAKLEKELEKVVEALKDVEAAQAKNPIVLEDLDKLIKQLDALRKERDQRKITVTELLAEIDKLKVKLDTKAPEGVVFGTAVVGRLNVPHPAAITVPWSALSWLAGRPAVWKVDPAVLTVAQVPVTVSAYGGDSVTLSGGVQAGDVIVTAGSQLLFPGRSVTILAGGQ